MLYIKALHIIFIVTWFSGMFYIVRLFIYNTEAQARLDPERAILTKQYKIMSRRLWNGITIPSAIATIIFGTLTLWQYGYLRNFEIHSWLHLKLGFVLLLYLYFYSLHKIFVQQQHGVFRWTTTQLRLWNEVATIFLVSIIFLVVVKSSLSWLWGICGLLAFVIILMSAIKIYRKYRVDDK